MSLSKVWETYYSSDNRILFRLEDLSLLNLSHYTWQKMIDKPRSIEYGGLNFTLLTLWYYLRSTKHSPYGMTHKCWTSILNSRGKSLLIYEGVVKEKKHRRSEVHFRETCVIQRWVTVDNTYHVLVWRVDVTHVGTLYFGGLVNRRKRNPYVKWDIVYEILYKIHLSIVPHFTFKI